MFRVYRENESQPYIGSFKIVTGGVLKIMPSDESEPTIWLSPTVWREIEEIKR